MFSWDGNNLEPSKFHNYNDLNGFYLTVLYKGLWTPVDEDTWHVDGLRCMMSGTGTCIRASMDVTFDGNQYKITNLDRTIASLEDLDSDDPSKINVEHIEPSDSTPYLTVPAWKIQGDRDPAVEEDRNNRTMPTPVRIAWIEDQFDWWDNEHKQLAEMVKSQLNDEGSYRHEDTNYVNITSKEIRDEIQKTLNSAGIYEQIEVGDLVIMMEFSAKNAFNARIKNTAIGIAKYSSNTIHLVKVE